MALRIRMNVRPTLASLPRSHHHLLFLHQYILHVVFYRLIRLWLHEVLGALKNALDMLRCRFPAEALLEKQGWLEALVTLVETSQKHVRSLALLKKQALLECHSGVWLKACSRLSKVYLARFGAKFLLKGFEQQAWHEPLQMHLH